MFLKEIFMFYGLGYAEIGAFLFSKSVFLEPKNKFFKSDFQLVHQPTQSVWMLVWILLSMMVLGILKLGFDLEPPFYLQIVT